MEISSETQEPQKEPLSVIELTRQLIQLREEASIEYLITVLDKVWFDDSSLPFDIVDAIARRKDLRSDHIVRIVSRRESGGPIDTVCDLLPRLNPTINDLRFVFHHAIASRKRIASILADHPEATYADLSSANACDDLEEGCREKLEKRIGDIQTSRASILVRRIEQRLSQSNYRTN